MKFMKSIPSNINVGAHQLVDFADFEKSFIQLYKEKPATCKKNYAVKYFEQQTKKLMGAKNICITLSQKKKTPETSTNKSQSDKKTN